MFEYGEELIALIERLGQSVSESFADVPRQVLAGALMAIAVEQHVLLGVTTEQFCAAAAAFWQVANSSPGLNLATMPTSGKVH